MADNDTVERRRRGPDVFTLLIGVLAIGMAISAFVGKLPDIPGLDPRWLLAAGAVLVGLMLLVGSLRGRRDRR